MRLEAMYEQACYDCSDGFWRGRRAHDALHQLRERCRQEGMGGIVEADIRGYVARIDRTQLQAIVRRRVNEGSIRRLMGQWLRAGVMEDGVLTYPETGVGQGGGSSPVLAHILLQHVLDAWFERDVRPRLKGRCFLLRFADDFCIGGELEADARKIMAVLPKRFARLGLTLPPEKTALMAVGQPEARQTSGQGNGTVDFLGLTSYWAQSRRGCWVSKRRTARKRLRRTKKSLWRWCRANRHAPVQYQYPMRCLKWRGHFRDYGMRGNDRLLEEVRRYARETWRYWLSRRRSKSSISWEKFEKLQETSVLPLPKIVHNI